jgi:catechol 2,3-dioxygenase-like lactoylglutathione lyase family enzyme
MIQVRRLGHATLTTPDLDRAIDYYVEIIGLRLVARDRERAFLASRQGLEAIALEVGHPNALARLSGDRVRRSQRHGNRYFSDYAFAKADRRPAGITPLKLGHVAYRVSDVHRIVTFYTDVLGFRVSDWRADNFAFLRCGPDHRSVNFVVDEVAQLHHIAFEVKDWPEIQRTCEWLARNDIHLVWGLGVTSSATTSRSITATPTTCGSSSSPRWIR